MDSLGSQWRGQREGVLKVAAVLRHRAVAAPGAGTFPGFSPVSECQSSEDDAGAVTGKSGLGVRRTVRGAAVFPEPGWPWEQSSTQYR